MPTTNADFWDSLNHWRAHADMVPMHSRSIADKLGALQWAREDLGRQSRAAFVLKRAAELNKRPRRVDRDGNVTDPGHNGWPVVESIFAAISEAA